jgi:hypothetical protein
MAEVGINSVDFPSAYLRMDGAGVAASGGGSGTVNCQFCPQAFERFRIEPQLDGTVAIASVQFPGVFLRMDGTGVTAHSASGGGTVNCQVGVGSLEKFRIEPQPDGTVAIASVQFPGVYLRMDGTNVTAPSANGTGLVNCQFGVGLFERFQLTTQVVSSNWIVKDKSSGIGMLGASVVVGSSPTNELTVKATGLADGIDLEIAGPLYTYLQSKDQADTGTGRTDVFALEVVDIQMGFNFSAKAVTCNTITFRVRRLDSTAGWQQELQVDILAVVSLLNPFQ